MLHLHSWFRIYDIAHEGTAAGHIWEFVLILRVRFRIFGTGIKNIIKWVYV